MSNITAPVGGYSSGDRAWLLPSSGFGITVRQKGTASWLVSVAPLASGAAPLRLAAV